MHETSENKTEFETYKILRSLGVKSIYFCGESSNYTCIRILPIY